MECREDDECVSGSCQDNGNSPVDTPCDDLNACTSSGGVENGGDKCNQAGMCDGMMIIRPRARN